MQLRNIIVLLLLTLGLLSCNTTEPGKDSLEIQAEDTSCTEVWLKITGTTGKEIQLNRDGKEIKRFILSTSPMIIYDDSLSVKTGYSYQALQVDNGEKSKTITAATLDTTSHNFSWETWTFEGDAGSSSLYDVAIISEDNIWAVGEIYKKDTSENGYTMYNAVHWDGSKWELKKITFSIRILYPGSEGDSIGITPINSMFAFNENDIWFAAGTMQHWDGHQFKEYRAEDAGFSKSIWGSSSSDLYFVGGSGTIVHYNNDQWTKIETGTELPIRDIWGDFNERTNKYEILAVAADLSIDKGSKVLRIDGNNVTEEKNNGLSWDVGGIWFKSGSGYYIAGAGIHYKHFITDSVWHRYPQGIATKYTGDGITGSGINDIFAVGSFLEIAHFNGVTWHNYNNEISSPDGVLGRISTKGNIVAAVGLEGRNAIIILGKR